MIDVFLIIINLHFLNFWKSWTCSTIKIFFINLFYNIFETPLLEIDAARCKKY